MQRSLTALWVTFVLFFLAACGGGGGGGGTGSLIVPPQLVSIQITPAATTLTVGLTQQYKALATYTSGTVQDVSTSVSWRSSDPVRASINGTGLATAMSPGSTTIAASLDGVDSNPADLTVTSAALVSIEITPTTASLARGLRQQYTATGTYADASTGDITGAVSWNSSDTSKATISVSGLATAVAPGLSTITAALDGVASNSADLTVTTAALVSIQVTPATASQSAGLTQPYTAVGTYSDASTPDITSAVSWSSSDTSKATIGASGLATAVAVGSTSISASMDGVVSSPASLTVTAAPTWTASGALSAARRDHSATLLPDGKVLVTGGLTSGGGLAVGSAIYNPATGVWVATGPLSEARTNHTATLLTNGKVLVAGGNANSPLASCEIYDPATGVWTATGALGAPRTTHSATLLANGKVLVTGGTNSSGRLASSEIYDPVTGSWTATGALGTSRNLHTATLLANGKVLVTAGVDVSFGPSVSSEVYDPATGTWTATGALGTGRYWHTATLLANGKVLVAGGNPNGSPLASSEIYDPATGVWSATGTLGAARRSHSATLLANGAVLVTGGLGTVTYLASSEIYDPATGAWIAAAALGTPRLGHSAALLANGKVLVTGGANAPGLLASSELY